MVYSLPKLNFSYRDLVPFLSEEQIKIHYEKHHQAYVNGANAILEKIEKARKEGTPFDVKVSAKELSWHISGHLLHSLFWENLSPAGKSKIGSKLNSEIAKEFGSFERFKTEFTQAASTVEGSGWAALVYDTISKRLLIMQIEKHNVNVIPSFPIILVIDVFEHAYYIDYKNDRAKFIEGFWNCVNWDSVEKRLEKAK